MNPSLVLLEDLSPTFEEICFHLSAAIQLDDKGHFLLRDGEHLSHTAILVPVSHHSGRVSPLFLFNPHKWLHVPPSFTHLFPSIPYLAFTWVSTLILPSFTRHHVSHPRRTKRTSRQSGRHTWPRWPDLSQLAASEEQPAPIAAPRQNDASAPAGELHTCRASSTSSSCLIKATVFLQQSDLHGNRRFSTQKAAREGHLWMDCEELPVLQVSQRRLEELCQTQPFPQQELPSHSEGQNSGNDAKSNLNKSITVMAATTTVWISLPVFVCCSRWGRGRSGVYVLSIVLHCWRCWRRPTASTVPATIW